MCPVAVSIKKHQFQLENMQNVFLYILQHLFITNNYRTCQKLIWYLEFNLKCAVRFTLPSKLPWLRRQACGSLASQGVGGGRSPPRPGTVRYRPAKKRNSKRRTLYVAFFVLILMGWFVSVYETRVCTEYFSTPIVTKISIWLKGEIVSTKDLDFSYCTAFEKLFAENSSV